MKWVGRQIYDKIAKLGRRREGKGEKSVCRCGGKCVANIPCSAWLLKQALYSPFSMEV